MKKLVTLFLAAGMLLTTVTGAAAVEFRPSGEIAVGFFGSNTFLGNKPNFQDHDTVLHNTGDDTYEPIRYEFRLYYSLNLDFIASEQLSGRIGIKSSEKQFGLGASDNWESKFFVNTAYIDWYIPNTPVQVRLGRWTQGIRNFTGTLQLLSPTAPQDGVRLSAKINDNVTITGIWWRRGEARDHTSDGYNRKYADQYYLELPLTFDGLLATVWATYIRDQGNGVYGPGSAFSVNNSVAEFATWNSTLNNYANWAEGWQDSRVWAFGGGVSLSKFSPFVLAADFGYSNLEVDGVQFDTALGGVNAPKAFDRKGWYLSGRASYNTVYGSPGLFAWYTSGDDDDLTNGSERPLNAGTGPSGILSLFNSDYFSRLEFTASSQRFFSMIGTWGLSAQWSNASFVDDLSHSVALSYIRGTNDPFMARFQDLNAVIPAPYRYMTSKDSAIALELNNNYKIYKELTVAFDLFYIWQNFDANTWNWVVNEDLAPDAPMRNRLDNERQLEFTNAWGIGLSFSYTF